MRSDLSQKLLSSFPLPSVLLFLFSLPLLLTPSLCPQTFSSSPAPSFSPLPPSVPNTESSRGPGRTFVSWSLHRLCFTSPSRGSDPNVCVYESPQSVLPTLSGLSVTLYPLRLSVPPFVRGGGSPTPRERELVEGL